ncbi:ABC transporter permease [Sulfurospirillum sp. 1307]|jgi:simple sugar transport system permease protein
MDFSLVDILSILSATIRLSVPLIFAAMAGIFSERSGVVDISLEGKLLAGAFAAASVAAVTHSAWLGLLAAIVVSMLLSLVHGFACITHRGDQVISGVAINIVVAGLTVVLGTAWFHRAGQTPTLVNDDRFMPIKLPGVDMLSNVPILGDIYAKLISGHNILVYFAFLCVAITYWVLFKTRFGLRLRAVGENPKAVDTAGISVAFLRYRAVLIGGILTGIGGTYISIAQNASFIQNMSAGKGYIALAAMIFGKWKPIPAMLSCFLFGFLEALSMRLQGISIPFIGQVPVQLIQAAPYILTVILLAGFIGRAVAPKADGVPYVKER